jgi:N-methylhydantoinase B
MTKAQASVQAHAIDSITAEVISRHLLSISEEMAATLIRTSFSPNIKERADCSTAIFDRQGRVIAQAQRVPIHLGSMIGAVDAVKQRYPLDEIRPGDMFVANDPYTGGGSHLPDINIIAPVFWRDEIVAYVANIAHHADVGGMVAGSEAAVCRSIFQEGLRIPPVRILNAGKVNRDVLDIILLNSRTPDERNGDLRAQFAANVTGIRSVQALFDRYGEATESTINAYLTFTRKRFEVAIGKIKPGTYRAEDFLDGNVDGETARIALALTVSADRLTLDFTGTAPQLSWARNIPNQALIATIYTVAKSLLDPDVPANAGYFETMNIIAPAGSLVQPVAPAPVGCRSISCGVLGDAIASALSQAMPERALTGSGPHHLAVFAGPELRGDGYFVNYETVAGGMGARPYRDGIDAVRVHASGAANLPVEALEHAYPLRIERYALRDGSGGAGKHRGGAGVLRDYRALVDGITVSLSSERQNVPAPGLAGGQPGEVGGFVLNPGTSQERKLGSAEADVPLPRGDVLSIQTPGGGGYGPPVARDAQSTETDRREGRLGPHAFGLQRPGDAA